MSYVLDLPRGLDLLNVAYHYLDIVPKGRDEENTRDGNGWVRRRDKYADAKTNVVPLRTTRN